MIISLNISLTEIGKDHMSASFHCISPENTGRDIPYKEITGSSVEVTNEVLHELNNLRVPVQSFQLSPDLPPEASSVIRRAMMAHLRGTVPVERALLKVSGNKKEAGDIINVQYYNAIDDEELGLTMVSFSGLLLEVVDKTLQRRI